MILGEAMTFNICEGVKLKIYIYFYLFFQRGKMLKPDISVSALPLSPLAWWMPPIPSGSTSCGTLQSVVTSQQRELPALEFTQTNIKVRPQITSSVPIPTTP